MLTDAQREISLADSIIERDQRNESFTWSDVPTYAGAMLADTVLTTLDSITPDEWWQPVRTYDWLTEKGFVDTAEYYRQNQSAVELGSFLTGVGLSAVGGGVVLGALRAGRLGALSANPFTRFQRNALRNKEEALRLVDAAEDTTKAYKNLRSGMRNQQLLHGLVEGASYEAAFLALMNGHPWMEDYNLGMFALGTGIGGFIGGPVKYWAMNREFGLAAKDLQLSQLRGAKSDELFATSEMGALTDTGEILSQRAARIEEQRKALAAADTGQYARKFIDDQTKKDEAYLLRDIRDRLLKGMSSKPSEFQSKARIGTNTGIDNTYEDTLFRMLVDHPTKANLQGAKRLRPWTKAEPADEGVQGGRAILDPRGDDGMGVIIAERDALTNLRAADDQAYRVPRVTQWDKLPKVQTFDDYLKLDTQGMDKSVIESMMAKLPEGNIRVPVDDIYKIQRLASAPDAAFQGRLVHVGERQLRSQASAVEALKEAKQSVGQRLIAGGETNERMATMLNMTEADVRLLRTGDVDQISGWGLYSAKYEDMRKWGRQKKAVFDGDPLVNQKLLNQEAITRLDRAALVQGHAAIRDRVFTDPEIGALPAKLYDDLISDQAYNKLGNNVSDYLPAHGVGTRRFASADFSLRNWGELGDLATSLGARLKDWTNREVSNLNVGLGPLKRQIQADRVQSALFETMYLGYTRLPGGLAKKARWDPETGYIELPKNVLRTEGLKGTPIKIEPESLTGRWLSEWTKENGANHSLDQMQNAISRLKKSGHLEDGDAVEGLYFPFPNMEKKFLAYKQNTADMSKTQLIAANSEADLQQLIAEANRTLRPNEVIVLRSDKARWDYLHNYHHEYGRLERFNAPEGKAGVGIVGASAKAEHLDDIMQGLHWELTGRSKSLVKNSHPFLIESLQNVSKFHRAAKESANQTVGQSIHFTNPGGDPGTIFYNTLMNNSGVGDFPLMQSFNNVFEAGLNYSLGTLNNALRPLFGRKGQLTPEDFQKVNEEMAAQGLPNPYTSVDSYLSQNSRTYQDLAQGAVNTSNAVMATLNLRLAELGHAAVTLLSYPIAMVGPLAEARLNPMRHMMDGIKFQFGRDEFSKLVRERAAKHGFLDPKAYLFEQAEAFSAGLSEAGGVRRILESDLVKILSKPSDWSEKAVRHQSYFTGLSAALQKDPGLKQRILQQGINGPMDVGEHLAHGFTLRTMGNYNGTQRPQLFQGALGNAMMLYQTYMLTMAQNMFRFLEKQDTKAVGALLGAQASTFGLSTLPLYEYMNKATGDYILKDNMDISSMTHRVFGKDGPEERNMAEFILYGLPSAMMNTALSSRAELQPRLPLSLGTEGALGVVPPVVSQIYQGFQLAGNALTEMTGTLKAGGGPMDYLEAGGRALAMQSMWRPGKGIAELAQGYTLDRKGQVVENASFQEWGNLTRAFGLRPLEEHVLRQTRYMNRYYDAKDGDNRAVATRKLREMVTQGRTGLDMGNIAAQYLENGGTSRGWTAALNKAYIDANVPLANRLKEEITRQPLLDDVVDSYIY